jgi:hypothetical protein
MACVSDVIDDEIRQARESGEEALATTLHDFYWLSPPSFLGRDVYVSKERLGDALRLAFDWSLTPQGYEWWEARAAQLSNEQQINNNPRP